MTAFSGVRSSWDILARNSLLWRLAISSSIGPRPQLLEQPDILDRNHRLIGECPQQGRLLVRERPRRAGGHADGADGHPAPEHRHGEEAPIAQRAARRERGRRHVGFRLDIPEIDLALLPHRSRHDERGPGERLPGRAAFRIEAFGRGVVVGDQTE